MAQGKTCLTSGILRPGPPTSQISTLVTTTCRGSWRGRPVRPTTTLWRPLSRPSRLWPCPGQ
ncbi:Transposable element Tc3 transposase [Caligus rogercresseyi]|uniref:Transposable element Tc3 transposase n=1 Tax=Caligus rogercresseyi TaxID=217165 RepID=A0A7T8JWY1_CALRO|nr:Transposable element Tc3 transposase [Caligus rogercresseyi]